MRRQARRTASMAVATPQSNSARLSQSVPSTANAGGWARVSAAVGVRTAITSSEAALAYANRGAAASARPARCGARRVTRPDVPGAPRHRLLGVLESARRRATRVAGAGVRHLRPRLRSATAPLVDPVRAGEPPPRAAARLGPLRGRVLYTTYTGREHLLRGP